jgi:hypothetical protein
MPKPSKALATGRMQRPQLTPAPQRLVRERHPAQRCRYCEQHRLNGTQPTEWLLEPPKPGEPLHFYCTHCGHFELVEP